MNLAKVLSISVFILFIAMSGVVVFAQDAIVLNSNDPLSATMLDSSADMEGSMQWVWGEVTSLDTQANTFTLKYLDYETDQEKELVLVVDENTVYENAKNFNEIKVKDTLSVDYKIASDGKNLAKDISLEKSETFPADAQDSATGNLQLSAPAQTAAPVLEEPMAQPETVEPATVASEVVEPEVVAPKAATAEAAMPEVVAPEAAPVITQQAQ